MIKSTDVRNEIAQSEDNAASAPLDDFGPVTPDQFRETLRALATGASHEEIAATIGIGPEETRAIQASLNGLRTDQGYHLGQAPNQHIIDEALDYFDGGVGKLTDIASAFGLEIDDLRQAIARRELVRMQLEQLYTGTDQGTIPKIPVPDQILLHAEVRYQKASDDHGVTVSELQTAVIDSAVKSEADEPVAVTAPLAAALSNLDYERERVVTDLCRSDGAAVAIVSMLTNHAEDELLKAHELLDPDGRIATSPDTEVEESLESPDPEEIRGDTGAHVAYGISGPKETWRALISDDIAVVFSLDERQKGILIACLPGVVCRNDTDHLTHKLKVPPNFIVGIEGYNAKEDRDQVRDLFIANAQDVGINPYIGSARSILRRFGRETSEVALEQKRFAIVNMDFIGGFSKHYLETFAGAPLEEKAMLIVNMQRKMPGEPILTAFTPLAVEAEKLREIAHILALRAEASQLAGETDVKLLDDVQSISDILRGHLERCVMGNFTGLGTGYKNPPQPRLVLESAGSDTPVRVDVPTGLMRARFGEALLFDTAGFSRRDNYPGHADVVKDMKSADLHPTAKKDFMLIMGDVQRSVASLFASHRLESPGGQAASVLPASEDIEVLRKFSEYCCFGKAAPGRTRTYHYDSPANIEKKNRQREAGGTVVNENGYTQWDTATQVVYTPKSLYAEVASTSRFLIRTFLALKDCPEKLCMELGANQERFTEGTWMRAEVALEALGQELSQPAPGTESEATKDREYSFYIRRRSSQSNPTAKPLVPVNGELRDSDRLCLLSYYPDEDRPPEIVEHCSISIKQLRADLAKFCEHRIEALDYPMRRAPSLYEGDTLNDPFLEPDASRLSINRISGGISTFVDTRERLRLELPILAGQDVNAEILTLSAEQLTALAAGLDRAGAGVEVLGNILEVLVVNDREPLSFTRGLTMATALALGERPSPESVEYAFRCDQPTGPLSLRFTSIDKISNSGSDIEASALRYVRVLTDEPGLQGVFAEIPSQVLMQTENGRVTQHLVTPDITLDMSRKFERLYREGRIATSEPAPDGATHRIIEDDRGRRILQPLTQET